jgi:hypothetical protein
LTGVNDVRRGTSDEEDKCYWCIEIAIEKIIKADKVDKAKKGKNETKEKKKYKNGKVESRRRGERTRHSRRDRRKIRERCWGRASLLDLILYINLSKKGALGLRL